MSHGSIIAELAQYGPDVVGQRRVSLLEAQIYCRRLATSHYENFTVGSWLLPHEVRQHFFNVYAYCRWADDLADETGDTQRSLMLLDWWERQLDDCLRGRALHPVFVALIDTIETFSIPDGPFRDLLRAFRRDQRQTRYDFATDVLEYCRCSANPVGRLVLHMSRCHTDETARLSDSICTGLQLANFCQDVARDFDRGRIYLPRESWRQFGYSEESFQRRECNDPFRQLLAHEVLRARDLLRAGWPLIQLVSRNLQAPVALFARGGAAILDAIAAQKYDVWTRRPMLSKLAKGSLICHTYLAHWLGKLGKSPPP